jgi:hypothetical protein
MATRRARMFPRLSPAQVDRIGRRRAVRFQQNRAFHVLEGGIEVEPGAVGDARSASIQRVASAAGRALREL